MRKHQDEMIRFAKTEPGTVVWFRPRGELGWEHTTNPGWNEDFEYIVQDEYANLRMAISELLGYYVKVIKEKGLK